MVSGYSVRQASATACKFVELSATRTGEPVSNGAQLLQAKYELVKGTLEGGDAEFIPASKPSQLLIGVNPTPIRILNPWGAGSTQDLPASSTLKLDGDKVTGIEGEAFAKTWSRTTPDGEILKAAPVRVDPRNPLPLRTKDA